MHLFTSSPTHYNCKYNAACKLSLCIYAKPFNLSRLGGGGEGLIGEPMEDIAGLWMWTCKQARGGGKKLVKYWTAVLPGEKKQLSGLKRTLARVLYLVVMLMTAR